MNCSNWTRGLETEESLFLRATVGYKATQHSREQILLAELESRSLEIILELLIKPLFRVGSILKSRRWEHSTLEVARLRTWIDMIFILITKGKGEMIYIWVQFQDVLLQVNSNFKMPLELETFGAKSKSYIKNIFSLSLSLSLSWRNFSLLLTNREKIYMKIVLLHCLIYLD